MGESQAAQLIGFVLAMTGLLLVLEVGLRRAHRLPQEVAEFETTALLTVEEALRLLDADTSGVGRSPG